MDPKLARDVEDVLRRFTAVVERLSADQDAMAELKTTMLKAVAGHSLGQELLTRSYLLNDR